MSRKLRIGLTLAAGLVLLALALYGVNARELRDNIERAQPAWLVVAACLYLSAYFVRSLRWRAILKPVAPIRVSEGFYMLMAGYFINYVVPIRAGEIAKSFFLKRLRGVPIATSLPTVFVDKLLELVSILLVVALIPILSVRMNATLGTLIYSVLGIFLASMALLLFAFRNPSGASRFLCSVFSWLPRRIYGRLADFIDLFVRGMGVARRGPRTLWALLGLTALAVLLDALYFFTMFRAFSVDVGFFRVLFGYTLLTLSYILPTPPAQIGYNEFVIGLIFAGGLAAVHIPKGQVMAVVLVAHALTGLIIAVA
ncbi:MAG: flippase-like domain-containing protein, partial [Candidatus Eisenbacteria bacterium]|nr:flippase-like domain-containing protein [Candidatus Eisenbacteria bacterium]